MWFLQLDWQFIVFFWFSAMQINEEWPKYNNEKVNFSQCVIDLKVWAITKEL